MKIAEIFHSIQGEGILAGVPSVFIRTSGCNLRCVWCDTPYTSWKPEGEQIAVEEIVSRCAAAGARHAVITGGEPMMFKDTVILARQLRERGFHITVETAGTLWQELDCQLMSISPKLANSTPPGDWQDRHERLRYQPDILRRLVTAYDYQLKFVIAAPADVDEAAAMVRDIAADPGKVVLMPEGTNAGVIRERAQWLVEICKQRNFRYSPRLQVDIWADHRGK